MVVSGGCEGMRCRPEETRVATGIHDALINLQIEYINLVVSVTTSAQ